MSDPWVVMDASLVIKAILPNPEFEICQMVVSELSSAHWAVPSLWTYEISNTITKAVHFKQLTQQEGLETLQHALTLPVQLIPPDLDQSILAYRWSLKLQRASIYDSFYLAIAEALDADFWTADKKLFQSLQRFQLPWLHLATPGNA
ncbi:MAG TPA: type II toxin-antitoxin system VapC family toxin [Anaerolineales bacterium]|nr:type II toxin-antitoxin system VapC family toxin [Anaerolineales bacterium]